MKQYLKYILFSFAFLIPSLVQAQTREVEGTPGVYEGYHGVTTGVATGKSVTPNSDGSYTITLEAFATGSSITTMKSIPSDVVLLLDYSSSMLTNDNITKLKNAVVAFVNQMKSNNSTLVLEDGQMGNRIAFVLYAGLLYDDYPETTQHVNNNNDLPLLNDYPYFNAKYVNQFIEVADLNASGSQVMYSGVNIISPSSQHDPHPAYLSGNNFGDTNKGTNTPAAMAKALELVNANLDAYSSSDRSTTVVLFTDGEPCNIYQSYYGGSGSSGFTASYANDCLASAKTIKGNGVPIFTVGLFNYNGNNSDKNRQTRTFVEYASSNYPDIAPTSTSYWTNNANLLNINDPMSGDYCSIVSDGVNLSGVFKSIADSSGGSTEEVPAESQVVDVISNSFNLPTGFNSSSVRVYTVNANSDGEAWDEEHPATLTVTDDDDYLTNPSKVKLTRNGSSITIDGFDYGKDDTNTSGTPNGNWVGWRERTSGNVFGGKKLVIEFEIDPDPMATGGAETNTNAVGSGVKIPIYGEDGTTITGWRMVNDFLPPHTTLPVYLIIQKDGLKYGESATFEVKRIRPKGWVAGKTDAELEDLLEYSKVTGKPIPGDGNWETWTKVILTQKDPNSTGANRQIVSKELVALDPYWVYSIEEDDWGWAYEYEVEVFNTSEQEKNPFTFVNTDKVGAVKHAEAVMINHFKEGSNGKAEVEHYKSGKLEAF